MEVPKRIAAYLLQIGLWPGFLLGWVAVLVHFLNKGYEPVLTYAAVFYVGNVAIFALEYVLPYSLKWRRIDNQFANDIMHTLAGGWARSTVVTGLGLWFALYVYGPKMPHAPSIWEGVNWWLQLAIALTLSDLGRYWYHRTIHERWGGWAFHSLHHAARRLWVGNAGRTHFIDAAGFTFFGFVFLFALQMPPSIIFWTAIVNAMIGALSHCNIKMRLGVFNYIFNTPVLHRWHHSNILAEGNRNYGQVFALWDHVFGTYHNPGHDPSEEIGTRLKDVPDNLIKQFYYPLVLLATKRKGLWLYIGEKKPKKVKPKKMKA